MFALLVFTLLETAGMRPLQARRYAAILGHAGLQ